MLSQTIIWWGGWLTVRQAITVGDIQAFIQYVRSFNRPLAQLANISNVLQQTVAAAERVFEFLEEPEEGELEPGTYEIVAWPSALGPPAAPGGGR